MQLIAAIGDRLFGDPACRQIEPPLDEPLVLAPPLFTLDPFLSDQYFLDRPHDEACLECQVVPFHHAVEPKDGTGSLGRYLRGPGQSKKFQRKTHRCAGRHARITEHNDGGGCPIAHPINLPRPPRDLIYPDAVRLFDSPWGIHSGGELHPPVNLRLGLGCASNKHAHGVAVHRHSGTRSATVGELFHQDRPRFTRLPNAGLPGAGRRRRSRTLVGREQNGLGSKGAQESNEQERRGAVHR